jgi:hypothetical protein
MSGHKNIEQCDPLTGINLNQGGLGIWDEFQDASESHIRRQKV